MKKNVLLLSTLLISTSLYSNTLEKKSDGKGGYSYGGIGIETVTYSENGLTRGKNFNSKAKVTSPVYMTGSLTQVNEKFDFSIDAISTLVSNSTTENWEYDNQFAQSNQFDSSLSELKVLLHYKLKKQHKMLIGPKYTSFSAKRHTFKDSNGNPFVYRNSDANSTPIKNDKGETLPSVGLSEENVSTFSLALGYEFENEPFGSDEIRFKVSTLLTKPIWRRADNTAFEEVSFKSTTGYGYELNSYLGYKLMKNVEIGLFAEYNLSKKNNADYTNDSKGNRVQWPNNELKVFRSGIKLLWNFN